MVRRTLAEEPARPLSPLQSRWFAVHCMLLSFFFGACIATHGIRRLVIGQMEQYQDGAPGQLVLGGLLEHLMLYTLFYAGVLFLLLLVTGVSWLLIEIGRLGPWPVRRSDREL